jgi:hypothetical protein
VNTETKVKAAEALFEQAQNPRRRARPDELVMYQTFAEHGIQGEEKLSGFDVVEVTRTREPSILLRRIQRWLFSSEVLLLPRDALYRLRLARYWAGDDKAA